MTTERKPVSELVSKWDQVLSENDRVMADIYRKSEIERVVYQPKKGSDEK